MDFRHYLELIKDEDRGQLINVDIAKLISNVCTASFLLIHIVLLFVFYMNGVRPMAIFNIGSVLFYISMFPTIDRERFKEFIFLSYVEVALHMSAAVYFVGWECGFQVTLVGINMLLFLSDYCGRVLSIGTLPTLPISFINMLVYLSDYVMSRMHPALYVLSDTMVDCFQIGWGIVTFVIVIICLQSFVWLTFSSETRLSRKASIDNLTKLHNRSYINEYISKTEEEYGLEGCWVAMTDIDDFKAINDTYGHMYGDYVLKTLAGIIERKNVDAEICRWGGEEFLFTGFVDSGSDIHLARLESLRKAVEEHDFFFEDIHTHVTITVGYAEYEEGMSVVDWIKAADAKLYEGKRSGKNCIVS